MSIATAQSELQHAVFELQQWNTTFIKTDIIFGFRSTMGSRDRCQDFHPLAIVRAQTEHPLERLLR
jgi:hypothetical protein